MNKDEIRDIIVALVTLFSVALAKLTMLALCVWVVVEVLRILKVIA
jgi:hypothetical protein